jgi:hypothetical protein
MTNPFHKNYRTLQRWQIRCQESYLDRLRQMAPHDRQALAHAEETLAQMQAAVAGEMGTAGQSPR